MNQSMMKLLPSLLILAFAPSALAGGVNFATGTNPIYWKVPSVKYYVNPAGSEDISDGSDLDAVDESYSDWCDLPCSNIKANYSGTATTTNMLTNGDSNGDSEVTWVENAAWKYGSGVLGITSPLFYNDGTIIEADIALNGLHHTWTTANPFNKVDTKSIVLHEVGHWYGIQHYLLTDYPQNDPPTMTPAWSGSTQTRTLGTQDTIPFCYLYGSKACSSDADCPYVVGGNSGNEYIAGQYSCNGGQCTWDGGGGGTGGGTSGGGTPDSCDGICGQQASSGCYCDDQCQQYNDCCPDYVEICINGGTSGGGEEEGGSGEEEGGSGEEEGGGGNGNCPDDLAFEGCCDDLVLTWCDNGNVQTLDCQNTCGWDGQNGFYNCNVESVPDPSGQFPLTCGGGGTTTAEGGEEGGTTTTGGGTTEGGAETCEGGVTFVGCCDGTTLTWCDQGALKTLGCSGSCGWSGEKGYFDCNEPPQGDPSGEYPLVCPGGASQTTEESGGEEEGGEEEGGEEEGGTPEESGGETSEESGGENPEESGGESTTGTEAGAESAEEGEGEPEPDFTGGEGAVPEVGSAGGEAATPETPGGFVIPVGENTSLTPSIGTTTSESGGCTTNGGQTGGILGLLMFAMLLGLRQRKLFVL